MPRPPGVRIVDPRPQQSLFDEDGRPSPLFNSIVRGWLDGSVRVRGRKEPTAFQQLRALYAQKIVASGFMGGSPEELAAAHRSK